MAIPVAPSPPPYNPIQPFPTSGFFWSTSYFYAFQPNWIISGTGFGVNSQFPNLGLAPKLVYKNSQLVNFRKDKVYQYITQVGNFYNGGLSFSISTKWGDFSTYDSNNKVGLGINNLFPNAPGNGYLYFYSSPNDNLSTNDIAIYEANKNFGSYSVPNEKIYDVKVHEIDFQLQGYSWWRDGNSTSSTSLSLSASTDGLGWSYYEDTNSYVWFDDVTGTINPAINMIFVGNRIRQKMQAPFSKRTNHIVKYINTAKFNLSLTYTKISGSTSDSIDIYLSQDPPEERYSVLQLNPSTIPNNSTLLASYTQSGSTFSSYFGLQGNQYLIITASPSTSYTILALSDIQITGGYWQGTNRRYVGTNLNLFANPTTIIPIGLTGATFSTFTGNGNTYNATQSLEVQQLFSKIGNGRFMAGIWENGVWNSGWRVDENLYEFYRLGQFYEYDRGKVWRFQIIGPALSVKEFSVGDKISVGNIVAIDFNENRKLLKGYYTILSKTSDRIVIEVISDFPLHRIEKDSSNHRIYITKNIWLNGAFLNGYFQGVWNNGLFKGYPLNTEMFNSHWIDGNFDGGHFYANYYSTSFSNTYFVSGNKVGLSFSQPHKLTNNDLILIDKTFKGINARYDGTASVVSVTNEYQIITDIDYNLAPSQSETGTIYTSISSGLIQNFNFQSRNKSRLSSTDYMDSEAIFLYNSWIDVNYFSYSSVNIGRPNTNKNNISQREFSPNNLYGYPTDDVLSSNSTFRNSYNIQENTYKLGTKYKIYNDFIGRSSTFDDYFNPTNTNPNRFIELGWTYAEAGTGAIIFSRSVETRSDKLDRQGYSYSWFNVRPDLLVGSELQVDSISSGGVLDIGNPVQVVDFRNIEPIQRTRYSMIEFELVRWSGYSPWYELNDSLYLGFPVNKYKEAALIQPTIHFDNINTTVRDIYYGSLGTFSTTVNATYFPVWENVNHLLTPVTTKRDYFFNKSNLSMNFRGSGWYGSVTSSVLIDNLKYYEVDMIPFFQYFTINNINFGIEVPFQGIAPFIDYSDANFQFLDNLSLGFDSFSVNASNVAISGVGVGIGFGFIGGDGNTGVPIGVGSGGIEIVENFFD